MTLATTQTTSRPQPQGGVPTDAASPVEQTQVDAPAQTQTDTLAPDAPNAPGHTTAYNSPQTPQTATSPWKRNLTLVAMLIATCAIAVVAMGLGRFGVPPNEVARILVARALELTHLDAIASLRQTWTAEETTVVLNIRLPRVLLALVVGGGLAVSGAGLQALFRNPLVSPDIIGVSSGAAFGGVIAIALGLGSVAVLGGSFLLGVAAVLIVLLFGQVRAGSPVLMIILGGIVIASFFSALVSLVTFLADPYTTLPAVTFWLMGSLATASYHSLAVTTVPVLLGLGVVFVLRWRINILALGDEDALSLGVNPRRLRVVLITAIALVVAATVAVAGVIGWVGLVIPHLVRLLVGADYRQVVPGSFIVGGGFMILIDTVSRTAITGEIPLGVVTALIGAPFFAYLLIVNRNKELRHA